MAVRGTKALRVVRCGLDPAEIAPANHQRLGLIVRNVGKCPAYFAPTQAVGAGAPIVLAAGETFRDFLSWDAWWACSDNKDGTTLALIEIVR